MRASAGSRGQVRLAQNLLRRGAGGVRVGAEVQAGAMKSKNLRGHAQAAGPQARNPRAGIGGQQLVQLAKFAGEFLRRRVGARSALGRALQPPHHDAQLAPVEFAGLVNGFKSPGGGKTPHVPIDLAAQSRFQMAIAAGERSPAQHAAARLVVIAKNAQAHLLRRVQTCLRRHKGVAIAVRSHPGTEAQKGNGLRQARIAANHLRAKLFPKAPRQVVNGAFQEEAGVLTFHRRRHHALAHLIGKPQGFNPRVDVPLGGGGQIAAGGIQRSPQAQDVVQNTAALGLGGVGGQHRLNVHGLQQLLDGRGGHPLPAQFAERVAQRHGRTRPLPVMRVQAADALAFLAKIDEVKKEAESMRDGRGLLHRKAIDRALLGL